MANYINDQELRRIIQAATCKSEEFSQFVGWIRFGSGGVISDNMRPNQRKIIRSKAINKLRNQGIEIPDEILSGIPPYWTEHFNRLAYFR